MIDLSIVSLWLIRRNVIPFHVAHQLHRDFIQGLLCQFPFIFPAFIEINELHYVSLHVHAPCTVGLHKVRRVQVLCVSVKLVHSREIVVSNSYDHDREGQQGPSYDLVDCVQQVVAHAICDDEKDHVLLISLRE